MYTTISDRFDKDNSGELDLNEFLQMQPAAVRSKHSEEEIKAWFAQIDIDGDNSISINEYFTWSLSKALSNGDSGLRAVFQDYDKDGTGYLDEREFQKICDDIGFGAAAHDIFMEASAPRNIRGSASSAPLAWPIPP